MGEIGERLGMFGIPFPVGLFVRDVDGRRFRGAEKLRELLSQCRLLWTSPSRNGNVEAGSLVEMVCGIHDALNER